jgi:hypothetical protein
MLTNFKQVCFASLAIIFIYSNSLYAEQLQVTDYLGLLRAQKEISGSVVVTITVRYSDNLTSQNISDYPLLVHKTGISSDIESSMQGPNTFIFNDVKPGVWRIRLRNKGLTLDSVIISD